MIITGKLTQDEVSAMATKDMVALYNAMAEETNNVVVKKFRDRKTAVARVIKMQDSWNEVHSVSTVAEETVEKINTSEDEKSVAIKTTKRLRRERNQDSERAVKKPKAKKVDKQKRGSIKQLAIQLITDGEEDKEIVHAVKEGFPESKFDFSHVSWYRSTLFRDGIIGPEHAPRRTKAYKNWKKENSQDNEMD